jgi:hypothetical protein
MDWLALPFLILAALVLPILFTQFFEWARKRWRLGSKPRRNLVYVISFAVSFSVLGPWAGYVMLSHKADSLPVGSRPEKDEVESLPEKDGSLAYKGEVIPKFPWPPPVASSFVTIPLRGLLASSRIPDYFVEYWYPHNQYLSPEQYRKLRDRRAPVLYDANALLVFALARSGHYEISYYSVPDGFALVSRLEQIETDGSPKSSPTRRDTRERDIGSFSLRTYLRALFLAAPGYYRLVVFVVTPHPFSQSAQSVSFAQH